MDRKPFQLPLPNRMSVEENPDLLVITYKWNQWLGYVMVIFSAIWSLGLYFIEFEDLKSLEVWWRFLLASPFLGFGFTLRRPCLCVQHHDHYRRF